MFVSSESKLSMRKFIKKKVTVYIQSQPENIKILEHTKILKATIY